MCAVEWKKLGDVCEIKNGYTPSTKNSDFWIGGNIPWFTLEDIRKNGRILNDSIKHITSKGLKKGGLFPKDSIIISTTATIGEYALVTSDYICNQQITSISLKNTEKNNILIKYLYYLADDLGKWCLKNVNGGGSLLIISISKLNNYLIPLPPLAKQQEIVSQLDTFTTLISNLESELDMRCKQYEHYRNQLLDFEGVEGVEWMKIGDLFEFKNGLNKEKQYFGQGTPIVNYTDVYHNRKIKGENLKGRVTLTDSEIQRYKVKRGDVFFTRTSETREEIGLAAVLLEDIEDCTFSGFLLRARPVTEKLISEFCGYYFTSHKIRQDIIKSCTFTTRALTNGSSLSKIEVAIPSKQTQQQIVEKLDTFEQLIQSLETEIKLRKQQYEYYREKLLTFEK